MKPTGHQYEFDLENRLPSDKQYFSVRWLARHFDKSARHFINLIEDGSIEESFDMRSAKAKRADRIVHREALLAYLKKARELSAAGTQEKSK